MTWRFNGNDPEQEKLQDLQGISAASQMIAHLLDDAMACLIL